MNKRQKKKQTKQPLALIVQSKAVFKAEDYVKIKKVLQQQLDNGNVVILPAYLEFIAAVKGSGRGQIIIKKRGLQNEVQTVEEKL